MLDAGPRRRLALLLALPRHADRKSDDGDHLHRARGQLRAVERRAARAPRAARRQADSLALCPGLPAPAVSGDAGVRALRRDQGSRAPHRRRRLLLRAAGARGRRAPQLRPHARDHRRLLGEDRHPLPALALQPDRRSRLHLRRHGEHVGDHADRSRAARRARGDRPRRRGAGVARAGAPVVGRPRHLPRVVRGLAQRGVRDLLRIRLARAREGPRRGRRRAARRRRGLPERSGPLPAPGGLPPVRGADPHLRQPPLRKRWARPAHAAERAGRRPVLARAQVLRRAPRARLGRDARSRARDRGGLGPQRRRVLRPLDRARRPPRARGELGLGRRAARRHAARRPEADRQR